MGVLTHGLGCPSAPTWRCPTHLQRSETCPPDTSSPVHTSTRPGRSGPVFGSGYEPGGRQRTSTRSLWRVSPEAGSGPLGNGGFPPAPRTIPVRTVRPWANRRVGEHGTLGLDEPVRGDVGVRPHPGVGTADSTHRQELWMQMAPPRRRACGTFLGSGPEQFMLRDRMLSAA